jgi:hypothetical protein
MLGVWSPMPWLLPTATLSCGRSLLIVARPGVRGHGAGLSAHRSRQPPTAASMKSETAATMDGADRMAKSL